MREKQLKYFCFNIFLQSSLSIFFPIYMNFIIVFWQKDSIAPFKFQVQVNPPKIFIPTMLLIQYILLNLNSLLIKEYIIKKLFLSPFKIHFIPKDFFRSNQIKYKTKSKSKQYFKESHYSNIFLKIIIFQQIKPALYYLVLII